MRFFKSAPSAGKPAAPTAPAKSALSHALLSLEKRYVFDAALSGELASLATSKTNLIGAMADDHGFGHSVLHAAGPGAASHDDHSQPSALDHSGADTTHAIYFIDANVDQKDVLIAGLPPGADVVVLDPNRDGVMQIAEAMKGRSGVDQIHIFAHGEQGMLSLGSSVLDSQSMNGVYRAALASIGSHLTDSADILVYGCDFAEGSKGAAAADLLSSLTGADVAASTNLTGAAKYGADWTLEYKTGAIEARTLSFDNFDATLDVAYISASGAPVTNGLHNVGAQATWSNVATIGGQPVDIRATVVAADASAIVTFGVTGDDLRMELENGQATVQWELFLAGTTTPVSADVNFQITDLDGPNIESVSAAATGYTVDVPTNLLVTNNAGVITAAGTQNQNGEPSSMIRFSWSGVSSMTVDYNATSGNDIRIFNHDGDLDLAFNNPITVGTPVLDLDGGTAGYNYATSFTEHGAGVSITDPTVAITNSSNIQTATVTLTNAQAGDVLTLGSLPGGISGSVDTSVPGQITVTLTGNTTAANYETALHNITFSNASHTPDTTPRNLDFTLQNASYSSATSTTTINVIPVNDPPTAVDDVYWTGLNTAVSDNVGANDSDLDGDALTYSVATSPSHGSVFLNANGAFTYTPTNGYVGVDTFTYTANDGNGGTSNATVTIYVNGAPVANNDSVTTNTNTSVNGDASTNDSDPNGDPLTFSVATNPTHGSVVLNANGTFTYTPTNGYAGADSFTYNVSDGNGGSATATVNVTVLNAAPVANNDSVSTAVSTPVNGDVSTNDSDPNADPLTFSVATNPTHGSVVLNANGTFTYTPTNGYSGADSFTYNVSDGNGGTASATVNVTVGVNPNNPPVANNDSVSTAVNTAVNGNASTNDSDPDGDTLTYSVATNPTHGSVVLNANGTFTYTPTNGYSGADSFTYNVSDGKGGTASATVNVTVANGVPVANNDSVSTAINTAVNGDVSTNDSDPNADPLTFSVATNPTHGSVVLNANGTFTYTPTGGYSGADSFTYNVSDGKGGTATATVNVTVANGVPVAMTDSVSTATNTPVNGDVSTNDSDPNGDPLTFSVATNPTHGSVVLNANGTFTYTPTNGYSGADSFTYNVSDGKGGTASATVNVTVANGVPVAMNDSFNAHSGASTNGTVAANDSDPNGDPLTYAVSTGPAHGSLTLNADGTFTYLPMASYTGTDTFTYQVTDGQGGSATATVTVTVTNTPPTTVGVTPTQNGLDGATVTLNASTYFTDADGNTLTYSATGLPTGLSIDPVTGVISGTIASGASGATGANGYSVIVTASDPAGASTTQTFTWNIANVAPTAVADTFSTTGTSPVAGTVATNDSDADHDTLTYTLNGQSAHGHVVFNADGSFTYTANALFAGADTFTYTVRDANGGTSTATVTVQVAAPTVLPPTITCINTFGDLSNLRRLLWGA